MPNDTVFSQYFPWIMPLSDLLTGCTEPIDDSSAQKFVDIIQQLQTAVLQAITDKAQVVNLATQKTSFLSPLAPPKEGDNRLFIHAENVRVHTYNLCKSVVLLHEVGLLQPALSIFKGAKIADVLGIIPDNWLFGSSSVQSSASLYLRFLPPLLSRPGASLLCFWRGTGKLHAFSTVAEHGQALISALQLLVPDLGEQLALALSPLTPVITLLQDTFREKELLAGLAKQLTLYAQEPHEREAVQALIHEIQTIFEAANGCVEAYQFADTQAKIASIIPPAFQLLQAFGRCANLMPLANWLGATPSEEKPDYPAQQDWLESHLEKGYTQPVQQAWDNLRSLQRKLQGQAAGALREADKKTPEVRAYEGSIFEAIHTYAIAVPARLLLEDEAYQTLENSKQTAVGAKKRDTVLADSQPLVLRFFQNIQELLAVSEYCYQLANHIECTKPAWAPHSLQALLHALIRCKQDIATIYENIDCSYFIAEKEEKTPDPDSMLDPSLHGIRDSWELFWDAHASIPDGDALRKNWRDVSGFLAAALQMLRTFNPQLQDKSLKGFLTELNWEKIDQLLLARRNDAYQMQRVFEHLTFLGDTPAIVKTVLTVMAPVVIEIQVAYHLWPHLGLRPSLLEALFAPVHHLWSQVCEATGKNNSGLLLRDKLLQRLESINREFTQKGRGHYKEIAACETEIHKLHALQTVRVTQPHPAHLHHALLPWPSHLSLWQHTASELCKKIIAFYEKPYPASLRTSPPHSALEAAVSYCLADDEALLFHGRPGTGVHAPQLARDIQYHAICLLQLYQSMQNADYSRGNSIRIDSSFQYKDYEYLIALLHHAGYLIEAASALATHKRAHPHALQYAKLDTPELRSLKPLLSTLNWITQAPPWESAEGAQILPAYFKHMTHQAMRQWDTEYTSWSEQQPALLTQFLLLLKANLQKLATQCINHLPGYLAYTEQHALAIPPFPPAFENAYQPDKLATKKLIDYLEPYLERGSWLFAFLQRQSENLGKANPSQHPFTREIKWNGQVVVDDNSILGLLQWLTPLEDLRTHSHDWNKLYLSAYTVWHSLADMCRDVRLQWERSWPRVIGESLILCKQIQQIGAIEHAYPSATISDATSLTLPQLLISLSHGRSVGDTGHLLVLLYTVIFHKNKVLSALDPALRDAVQGLQKIHLTLSVQLTKLGIKYEDADQKSLLHPVFETLLPLLYARQIAFYPETPLSLWQEYQAMSGSFETDKKYLTQIRKVLVHKELRVRDMVELNQLIAHLKLTQHLFWNWIPHILGLIPDNALQQEDHTPLSASDNRKLHEMAVMLETVHQDTEDNEHKIELLTAKEAQKGAHACQKAKNIHHWIADQLGKFPALPAPLRDTINRRLDYLAQYQEKVDYPYTHQLWLRILADPICDKHQKSIESGSLGEHDNVPALCDWLLCIASVTQGKPSVGQSLVQKFRTSLQSAKGFQGLATSIGHSGHLHGRSTLWSFFQKCLLRIVPMRYLRTVTLPDEPPRSVWKRIYYSCAVFWNTIVQQLENWHIHSAVCQIIALHTRTWQPAPPPKNAQPIVRKFRKARSCTPTYQVQQDRAHRDSHSHSPSHSRNAPHSSRPV